MAADFSFAAGQFAEIAEECSARPGAPSAGGHDDGLPHLGVYPVVPASAGNAVVESLAGGLAGSLIPISGIPALNSLAGAAASLYLDFTGHFDSAWGAHRNITTPAFDQDGDVTTFSSGELTSIQNIWAQVSEDFAPFKINVTTVEPASFANGVGLRVVIGGDGSWFGSQAGGVAYVNSFTNFVANTVYVFPKLLGNGYSKYVAEAVSHEAGHAFGLEHQSVFSSSGTMLKEYNPGTGAAAPIMGNSYSATRGLWSYGYSANHVMQDDLAVLSRSANGFGYRRDDHGNTAGSATALLVSGNSVSGSGIIHQTSDVDYFSFTTGAGQVNLHVNVAQFNNLDARLELRTSAGTLIASAAPTTSFGASITASVAAGSYRLVVASQGNYGDLGQYTVSGTIAPVSVNPLAAPSGLTATAVSSTQVRLSWSNVSGATGYKVERLVGGVWTQIGTTAGNVLTYQDSTAAAGTAHSYRVRAFNATGDSAASAVATVTTPSAEVRPSAPSALFARINTNRQVQLSWRDNSTNETVFVVQRSTNGFSWTTLGQVPAGSTGAIDTTAARSRVYFYRVLAYNRAGYSATSNAVRIKTPALAAKAAGTTSLVPKIQPLAVNMPRPSAGTSRAALLSSKGAAAGPAFGSSDSPSAALANSARDWELSWESAVDTVFGLASTAKSRRKA